MRLAAASAVALCRLPDAPARDCTARSMSGTVKNIIDGAHGCRRQAPKGGTDETDTVWGGLTTPGPPVGAPRLLRGVTSRL